MVFDVAKTSARCHEACTLPTTPGAAVNPATFEKIYEGKAKTLYRVPGEDVVVQRFKDSATAFNGQKFAVIEGKGELNNRISTTIFRFLRDRGIDSHFVDTINTRDMVVRQVEIVPLEVVTRNIAAGSLAKRLGLEEGTPLRHPIVEFYYKKDELGDPLLTRAHIEVMEIATAEDVEALEQMALAVNDLLVGFWAGCGLKLVDFKLEFGRASDGSLLLADEVSPDTSRLWDIASEARMDKDVFRRDLADLADTYREVHRRMCESHGAWEPGALEPAPADS